MTSEGPSGGRRVEFLLADCLSESKTFLEHVRGAVREAAHAVVQEAVNAGLWVFGAGREDQKASIVATDGTVTDGLYPETKEVIGGFSIIDVPSPEEALAWAAKIAVACRCAQEVRELLPDPEQDAMLRTAGRRW